MKTLKQIETNTSVSRTVVTLFNDAPLHYLIRIEIIHHTNNFNEPAMLESYDDYFRAMYRFLQLAMLYLS